MRIRVVGSLSPVDFAVISIQLLYTFDFISQPRNSPTMLASLVTSPTLDLSSPLSRRKQSIIGSPSISAHARTSSTSAHARTSSRSVDLAANLINNNTVARAAVAQEYANLRYREHCPLGMYVTPAMDNLLVWDAVLFVHRGAFAFAFAFTFPFPPPSPFPSCYVCADGCGGAK